jgi:hypothetical protein
MQQVMLASPAAKMPVFSAQLLPYACVVTVGISFQGRTVQAARPRLLHAANAAMVLYAVNVTQHIS